MVRKPLAAAAVAAALVTGCSPAFAQESSQAMVSANDANGVLKVLQSAGYDAELVQPGEDEGSTYIEIDTGNGSNTVFFSDCDDAVPDFCDTLVLSTWWDRETPISDAAIAAANINNKYVSVFRDGDGDPVMQWAILTRREGVPATVFLNALQRFAGVANGFSENAFAEDEQEESTASTE